MTVQPCKHEHVVNYIYISLDAAFLSMQVCVESASWDRNGNQGNELISIMRTFAVPLRQVTDSVDTGTESQMFVHGEAVQCTEKLHKAFFPLHNTSASFLEGEDIDRRRISVSKKDSYRMPYFPPF